MRKMFNYIFYKATRLDSFITGDADEDSQCYGSSILAVVLLMTSFLIFLTLKLFVDFEIAFNVIYVVVPIVFICVIYYYNHNKRYERIINSCEQYSKKEKLVYGFLSILYFVLLLSIIIGVTYLLKISK